MGRGFLWQRASLGYNANDVSTILEWISSCACEHGYCLVPVSWEEWSLVGCCDWRWEGFELGEDSFGRGPAWGMMPMI